MKKNNLLPSAILLTKELIRSVLVPCQLVENMIHVEKQKDLKSTSELFAKGNEL